MTSPWWPAEPSSVATRAPGISAAPAACAASRKPSSVVAPPERVAPDHQRRDPDAAAHEHRPAAGRAGGGRSRGRAGRAARRRRPAPSAHSRSVPGPTSSSTKSSRPSPWRRATENARGRNGRSSAPPPQRSAAASIANWPGSGAGPSGSATREHDVGPVRLAPHDGQPPAPERRERAVAASSAKRTRKGKLACPAHETAAAPSARCSSCSERTSHVPVRAEAIARAAAIPPVIVVMHGTPRAIAARRIS